MIEEKRFFQMLDETLQAGRDAVLVTVIYSDGSTPRDAGSRMILKVGAGILDEKPENLHLEGGKVVAESGASCPLSEVANTSLYYHDQHQIIASASNTAQCSPPPFAASFAEVEVDTKTGKVTVLDYVATVDCGTAINPTLAEGQNDGAVMNGLSYAMSSNSLSPA